MWGNCSHTRLREPTLRGQRNQPNSCAFFNGVRLLQTLLTTLLCEYVRSYVEESGRLARTGGSKRGRFWQSDLAEYVFSGKPGTAKASFSAMLSGSPRHVLTVQRTRLTLGGCREALIRQGRLLGLAHPECFPEDLERGICSRLGMPARRLLGVDDFLLEPLIQQVNGPWQFGVPDLIDWRLTREFASDVRTMLRRCAMVVDVIDGALHRVTDTSQQLRLIYCAICAAMAHHPGTTSHAAVAARIARMISQYSVQRVAETALRESDRYTAAQLLTQFHWMRFLPTGSSQFNCLARAIAGKPLDHAVGASVSRDLDEAIRWTNVRLAIRPGETRSVRKLASAVSLKARLLRLTPERSNWTLAHRLFDSSRELLTEIVHPYGLTYPVIDHLLQGRSLAATDGALSAAAICARNGDERSSCAFAALAVQLSGIASCRPSADESTRRLAWRAVRAPDTCYQFSHVFDHVEVRRLLSGRK